MARPNSHNREYVYTGRGRILTQVGVRYPIDAGKELSKPFTATLAWLRARPSIAKHCVLLSEYNKPAPAKEAAEAQEPKKAKPSKSKAKPKTKTKD